MATEKKPSEPTKLAGDLEVGDRVEWYGTVSATMLMEPRREGIYVCFGGTGVPHSFWLRQELKLVGES